MRGQGWNGHVPVLKLFSSLPVLGLGQDVVLADTIAAARIRAQLAVENQVDLGLELY